MPKTKHLTYFQKKRICEYRQRNKGFFLMLKYVRTVYLIFWTDLHYKDICLWAESEFGQLLSVSTISRILDNCDKFLSLSVEDSYIKRTRTHSCPELENQLLNWVIQKQASNAALSSETIISKAKMLAEGNEEIKIHFSYGWLRGFMKRHHLKCYFRHGEAADADNAAIEAQLPGLRDLISQYLPADVFNMDETGLFYRMSPNRTIAAGPVSGNFLLLLVIECL
jgi:hypothetical protein